MLAIVDYKAGNQTSVHRALEHLGIENLITNDPKRLATADGVIFPGVGAAGQAMHELASRGLDTALRELVAMKKPLLGICVGCQILLDHCEENDTRTLGILPGECRLFDPALTEGNGVPIRIPHMGWNSVVLKKPCPLFKDIPSGAEFYFVHSYYPAPKPEFVLAETTYGRPFCSMLGREGLWAVQFHPEKSGKPGLRLLKNFHAYCLEGKNA